MPGTEEKSLAESIVKEVREIDEARNEFKKQALINVMFLYGKHHFTITKRQSASDIDLTQRIMWEIEGLKRDHKTKRVSNYILPLFRSLLARLISKKANVFAEPMTSTEEDRNSARMAKEVAEDFWENCNRSNPWASSDFPGMLSVLVKLMTYELTVGTGYLVPWFNKKAMAKTFNEEINQIEDVQVGETEVRVVSPFNLFRDRFGRFSIERRYISPDQVEYEFDKKVETCEEDDDETSAQITRLLEGTSSEEGKKEGSYVFTKYINPTTSVPGGRIIVCTKEQVLFDGPLHSEYKNRNPVFEFKYQDLGFSSYGQGCIEQVVDLQQDYNHTLSKISAAKSVLLGRTTADANSKISVKNHDSLGPILFYQNGLRPETSPGVSPPSFLLDELMRIRRDMEDIMNTHGSSMGQDPRQVKSGVGIENLSNLDNQQIAPELIQHEKKLGYFTEMVLDICENKYGEKRLIDISGEDLSFAVKSFTGKDLSGQKRIRIRMGSNLPQGLEERQSFIINALKLGLINNDRAKELLEFGDVEGVFKSLDETAAKEDILNIIQGGYEVVAEQYEDHTIHLKVINDFRKGSSYRKLQPEVRMQIDDLANQHQQLLLAEQQAAASMGGPLPPAAIPPDMPK